MGSLIPAAHLTTVKPLYSEQSLGPKKVFTIQRCSSKRGDICSCIPVPEIQCTHIKTVSFLLWDSSGGRAIFHDSFFLFIFFDFVGFFYP